MKEDAAILLNLTGKFTIEDTDPLMSVFGGEGPLLFYDRLSVARFPSDASLYDQHIEHLVSVMHNLLEARTLSERDKGERIRLIVTLDMIGGAFQPKESGQKCFPAQKARQFKNLVAKIIGKDNPLLRRFDYCFLFLISNSENRTGNEFYCALADNGFTGLTADEWLDSNMSLNAFREDAIRKMDVPDDQWLLTRKETEPFYKDFSTKLRSTLNVVMRRMKETGVEKEFELLFAQKTEGIKTIGDFRTFDFDAALSTSICELIGLRASNFYDDTAFILLKIDNSNTRMRCQSEAFVGSLIQLLVTLSHEDFQKNLLSSNKNSPARIFSGNALDYDDFDADAFLSLEKLIQACQPKLEDARWKKDKKVSCKIFTDKTQDAKLSDAHHPINDKQAKERQLMFDSFVRIREVPSFFDSRIGEWKWYKDVVREAEDIYRFELINDRPLYDTPQRITDNEMEIRDEEFDYAELENHIKRLNKEMPETKRGKDLNTYLKERQALINQYSEAIEKMKKEMVKLGYFACLFWLGVFSTLCVILCYAYHFFLSDNSDSPWLIAVCFGVSVLLFVLGAVGAHASVKSKLRAVHYDMDNYYHQMQTNLQSYLDEVSERVKQQNEADIRRKNLDEMESRLRAFNDHNKQVDLWTKHYRGIAQKLSVILPILNVPQNGTKETHIQISTEDFDFDNTFPVLPYVIRKSFADKTVMFSTKQIEVEGATSFVRHFRLSEHND